MSSPLSSRVIDREGALRRMGDDVELLQDMATMFIGDAPKLLSSLHSAIGSGETEEVARAAHSIKGLASNFGGAACMDAAMLIEQSAKAGELTDIDQRSEQLKIQVDRLCEALRRDVLA